VTGYYKDIRNTIRTVTIISPYGVYKTNGNADYGDVRGVEISLRKQASRFTWGSIWGYANFTTQIGISGSSGAPSSISPTRTLYPASGDVVLHSPARLKAGLYYETPSETGFLGGILDRISLTMDYQLILPNKDDLSNIITYNGATYHAPAFQNLNAKIRKDFSVGDQFRFGVYAEFRNLTNFKMLNLSLFQTATEADVAKMIDSDFKFTPSVDQNGVPYLDMAKYQNLPRSVIFGLTMEL
jgi:outer membrane receptor protein involved in Fe transport